MFKKLILGLCSLCLLCVPAWAANNVEVSGHTIEISSIDEDFVSSTDTNLSADQNSGGLYVHSIYFKPAATDDECLIYIGSSSSGILTFNPLCADKYDERIKYFPPVKNHIYLDFTNGTYTAGSIVIIELWKYE